MQLLYFVLLLLAVVCFVATAFFGSQANRAQPLTARRVDLIALGLALAFAVPLIQHARLL